MRGGDIYREDSLRMLKAQRDYLSGPQQLCGMLGGISTAVTETVAQGGATEGKKDM